MTRPFPNFTYNVAVFLLVLPLALVGLPLQMVGEGLEAIGQSIRALLADWFITPEPPPPAWPPTSPNEDE
jgi:hypothetical protein